MPPPEDSIPIAQLARAAYCPRQLHYARREDDHEPPPGVVAARELAFEYERLRTARDETLRDRPIDVDPETYRSNLGRMAERDDYDRLVDPGIRERFLVGRDCHGVAHKVLEPVDAAVSEASPNGSQKSASGDGAPPPAPTPTVISPGDPPPRGVWEPQRVRAVAVAKALAWERERSVPRALVEYPTHGVVRTVRLTTRNKSAYRRTLWTVRSLTGVPPRVGDDSKCAACEYRERCGTKTRSLKTMLGLG